MHNKVGDRGNTASRMLVNMIIYFLRTTFVSVFDKPDIIC